MLVEGVPGVRFRLSSVEATQIDARLSDLIADAPGRLAPHVHAPLQSGSDRILKLMGRRWYTASDYRRRLESLAGRVKALGLGADVIVGFPSETEEDFQATRSLIEALPFTYLHVFPYSPRPGAPSTRLGSPPRPEVVRARSSELRALADNKRAAYVETRSDGRGDVVLLRRIGGRFEGLTEDYLSVFVSTGTAPPPRFEASLRLRAGAVWAEPVDA
jgi:threonylcarbamoyladenosine tRNA methylthiotransferase MtaB